MTLVCCGNLYSRIDSTIYQYMDILIYVSTVIYVCKTYVQQISNILECWMEPTFSDLAQKVLTL